jgi:hypothetical protein
MVKHNYDPVHGKNQPTKLDAADPEAATDAPASQPRQQQSAAPQ